VIQLADQKPAEVSIRGLIGQAITLVIILFLTKISNGSLISLSLAVCLTSLSILIISSIILYVNQYKQVRPKFSMFDFKLSKDLLNIGFKFFIIQIAGVIQFQTANFLIIRNFGAEDVTSYNIAYKYFSILIIAMGVIIMPLWSAVTDAYSRKDNDWIITTSKKYIYIACIFAIIGAVMLGSSNTMYKLWIGNSKVHISFLLSFCIYVYTTLYIFGSIFVGILNGIGELKIQFISAVISPFLFVGLVYTFIHILNWRVESIIIASIMSNFNAYILAPIQFFKIFKNKNHIKLKD
jgi:O-antigen/teichoic acid export membrane protein